MSFFCRIILFLTFLFAFNPAEAVSWTDSVRTSRPPFSIGLRSHYGFIIPHSSTIREVSQSNPWGLELDAAWLLVGDKAWNYCFCYPRMGLTVSYFNFANPRVLGNTYSLLYYVEPFLSYHRKINFSFRAGMGVTYQDTPYDAVNNPTNLFFSSPLSFLLQINLALNYRLDPKWNLRLAGYYNHISNGGMREPNKGINFPTASVGIDYTFRPPAPRERSRIRNEDFEFRKSYFEAATLFTAKTIGQGEQRRYPIVGLVGSYHRLVSRRSALNGGLEWVTDWTLKEKAKRENRNIDFNRLSLLFGHDLLIGRFEFSQHLGAYVYSPYKAMDPVYQRYTLRFRFSDRVFAGVSLKAHRQVADFMDARLGVRF